MLSGSVLVIQEDIWGNRNILSKAGPGQTFAAAYACAPGSVSPFGLINDPEHHVHLFLDRNLERFPAYSFHPNDNRATVVVSRSEFLRYLTAVGNTYEFIELY